jgi:excisionase family DNA binding protein
MRALTDLSHSRAPTVMALARTLISSVAMSGTPLPRWMTTGQAAQYLGCSEATLRQWRSRGTSPRDHKPAGSRLVRYQREDLDDFLAPGSTTHQGRRIIYAYRKQVRGVEREAVTDLTYWSSGADRPSD